MPLRRRPIAVTVTIVCVPLGATMAGLLGDSGVAGLRLALAVWLGAFVPIVAAVVLVRLLPESPRILRGIPTLGRARADPAADGTPVDARHGFVDPAERFVVKASIAALFHREYRRDTLALWGAFFSCLLAVYSVSAGLRRC